MHGRDHAPYGSDPLGAGAFQIKVTDDITAPSVGDGAFIMSIPHDLDNSRLVRVSAYVTTVSSSGTPTVQIRNITQSHDMLSTAITIDASEFTSLTAATPPVVDTTNNQVAAGDLIAIDVDATGTGTTGLGVNLVFKGARRPEN